MPEWYEVENSDEIPSPALLIYPDRVRTNIAHMVSWANVQQLRPHIKTHKMPQIVQMKLDAGITKFKVSTIAEAEMTAAAGGPDVLLAYQPVGPNIGRLIDLVTSFPNTTFSAIVDEIEIVAAISTAASDADITVNLFIDLNIGMNRTGITPDKALELYRYLSNCDGVTAAGLHAYDGHIHDCNETRVRQQAEDAFAPVWKLRDQLQSEGLAVPTIVGCGTPTSKLMVSKHAIEVSAGTSVLWDAGQPTFTPPLDSQNAAVLLARVISRPTEQDLCIDLGHKAVAAEMPNPRVTFFGLADATTVMQNEEHLVLRTPRADQFPVGTVLYGIPTHICPTVALYADVWCIENHRAVDTWPVVARTRRITI